MPVSPTSQSTAARKSATPKTPAEKLVAEAYQQNLGRAPDAGGMKSFSALAQRLLGQGKSAGEVREAVAENLRNSDEWRGRMIAVVYQENLGRKPDAAGAKVWAEKARYVAASGKNPGEVRQFVAEGLRSSPEWHKRMIAVVYKSELGRAPDAAGLKAWAAKANKLAAAGRPSNEIQLLTIAGLRSSPEWQKKQVGDLYKKVLGRAADAKGLAHFVALAGEYRGLGLSADQAHGHVRALLQNSAEYRAKHPGAKVPAAPPTPDQIRAFYAAAKKSARPTRNETGYVNGRPQAFQIREATNGKWLRADASDAFMRMYEKAKREGVDLNLVSGFRSMPEQQELYRRYRNGTGNLAARPGYSNHQGGIAIDVTTNQSTNHPAYRWLASNAAFFGFKRTVPSEPWHWEYLP